MLTDDEKATIKYLANCKRIEELEKEIEEAKAKEFEQRHNISVDKLKELQAYFNPNKED